MGLLTKVLESSRFNRDSKKASKELDPSGKRYRILSCPDCNKPDDFFDKFRNGDSIRFYVGDAYDVGPEIVGKIEVVHIASSRRFGSECYTFIGRFRLRNGGDPYKQVYGRFNLVTRRGWFVVKVSDAT
ncbi:hypothetical protein IKX64_01370 [Candidatus Saccharibacteria bacterium]|nr:hypothetical protein [Candidatus Saccharibacteria bacterium]